MAGFVRLELDGDASLCLDEMVALARQKGLDASPSLLVSDAVRCWHSMALGLTRVVVNDEVAKAAGKEPGEVLTHTLDEASASGRWH